MRCSRGQASFELVLIATVIIVLTSVVLANFIPLKNDTMGVAAAKEASVAVLSGKEKPYLVQRIDFSRSATSPNYNFRIFTYPLDGSLTISAPETAQICASISNATGWSVAEIGMAFNDGTAGDC